MDAQSYSVNPATTATGGYGTLGTSQPTVNGVGPGVRAERVRNEQEGQGDGNPNILDPAPRQAVNPTSGVAITQRPEGEMEMHPPYSQGELQRQDDLVRAISAAPIQPVIVEREAQQASSPAVHMQEFFTAETSAATSPDQPTTRWTTRVTEFLRTTASRGAHGVDRLLDNLGLQHVHVGGSFAGRTVERTVQISPPQQLPGGTPPPHAPPVPLSWAGGHSGPSLFAPEQLERMRQARRDHPLIYGQGSEVGSDNSSRLQAEVQRQLEEYAARYRDQVEVLQEEVRQLRDERSRMSGQRPPSPPRPPMALSVTPGQPERTAPPPPSFPPPEPPRQPDAEGQAGNLQGHSTVPGGQAGNLQGHSAVPGGQAANLQGHSAVPGGQAGNLQGHSAVPGGQAGNLQGHSAVPGGQAGNLKVIRQYLEGKLVIYKVIRQYLEGKLVIYLSVQQHMMIKSRRVRRSQMGIVVLYQMVFRCPSRQRSSGFQVRHQIILPCWQVGWLSYKRLCYSKWRRRTREKTGLRRP